MQEIKLFQPHVGQQEILASGTRFIAAMNGRRWGKTMLAVGHQTERAVNYQERLWWVAPTFPILLPAWRMATTVAEQVPYSYINKTERLITFAGGGSMTFKSADKEHALRGEGLDGLVIDEAAFVREEAWTQELRSALVDREGWAWLFSTPNGQNWFSLLHAAKATDPQWSTFQFPSSDNPYLEASEIALAKETMPPTVFAQEHMAVPMAGAGQVFTNVTANMTAAEGSRVSDHMTGKVPHMLVMTIDWAKHNDYTVIDVGCADCKQEVALERFNKIDFTFQRDRVKEVYDQWQPEIVIAEANAMGEPNIELLWEADIPVTSWMMTGANKPGLIRSLATALHREEWQFLDIDYATRELEAFEQKTNPVTGRSAYSAPTGGHDDTVIARALLVYGEANMGHVPMEVV